MTLHKAKQAYLVAFILYAMFIIGPMLDVEIGPIQLALVIVPAAIYILIMLSERI